LFNIAVCYEKSEQYVKAKEYFVEYLAKEPNTKDLQSIQARIRLLERLIEYKETSANWQEQETNKPTDKRSTADDKPADKPADKPTDKPQNKPTDKPADKPADKPQTSRPTSPRTNPQTSRPTSPRTSPQTSPQTSERQARRQAAMEKAGVAPHPDTHADLYFRRIRRARNCILTTRKTCWARPLRRGNSAGKHVIFWR
jgi:outer membrane biosynthesis protein TonB